MTAAAEIRATIRQVLEARGLGEIEVVTAMKALGLTTVHRTYLSDFLKDKKQSLSFDFSKELADFLEVDVDLLRVKRAPPLPVIHKGARPHLYIAEHMEDRAWDDAQVASRMDGIGGAETVRAWRERPEKLVDWQIQALLHAFGMDDVGQLARPPVAKKRAVLAKKKARKRA